ncbi:MAG: glutathione S-transferase family protein [Cyanobacteria bacterium P01_G01_bin.39]
MLQFYYKRLSLYSRPVWIALLEKQIPFQSIELALNGDQWQPEFLAINPFGRVPVLVDNNFAVFESLTILDYLELKYPTPALLPTDIEKLTVVRMIEMTTLHELIPAMLRLIHITDNRNTIEQANQQIASMLNFLEKHLIDSLYIGGDSITLAEIVAGSLILWLPVLGIDLSSYPKVESWSNQLMQRPTWQATQPDPEIIQDWLKRIKKLPKVRQRHWRRKRK